MSHINKKITLTLSFNPDKKIEKYQITLRDLALLDERSGISLFWPISFSRYKYIILQSFNPSFFRQGNDLLLANWHVVGTRLLIPLRT